MQNAFVNKIRESLESRVKANAQMMVIFSAKVRVVMAMKMAISGMN